MLITQDHQIPYTALAYGFHRENPRISFRHSIVFEPLQRVIREEPSITVVVAQNRELMSF